MALPKTSPAQSIEGMKAFLNDLASPSPAPGGGATAALMGAISAAQASMVAGLSIENKTCKKNPERIEALEEIRCKLLENQELFLKQIHEDARAYSELSVTFKMPRTTDAEKLQRHTLLQERLEKATLPPFSILHLVEETVSYVEKLLPLASVMSRSDLIVSALALRASASGAAAMVKANTMYFSDRPKAEKLDREAITIEMNAEKIASSIYEEIALNDIDNASNGRGRTDD